ncbi:arylamine N-acetyltransferase family protein [Sphingopyxis flava]|uniref:N-hydroxyarylamine O-acetyltransferase n=1 Tax=Sphingopyxis flava TaxID=1507287 RepID=A0A1T5EZ73_9SPHN|nr:arylamine N-acetyltransferase [Sphingopyxis flava]SKB89159.1 N-hydroxyarylamine O-acetyltransferase [Sphingopyxis flava]
MLYRPLTNESDAVPAPATDPFLRRYLARIDYAGPIAPTLDVLQALQAAHLAAIPFEAFDALVDGAVDIDPDAVDAKLIDCGRGGYCFEQNGLFLRALRAIGFDAEGLLGRVRWMQPSGAPPAPRSHMVLRVRISGRPWLADVGFGSAVPPSPLAMDSEAPQPTPHESYRIVRRGDQWSVRLAAGGDWLPVYVIDEAVPPAIDYTVANWYTSTHPDSHFRHQLIVARTTAEARYALRDNRLTIRRANGATERRFLAADAIEVALGELFGLPARPHWRGAIERAAAAEVEI